MTRTELLIFLNRVGACHPAMSWVNEGSFGVLPKQEATVAELWNACPEPGWMLWLWTALDPQCEPSARGAHGLDVTRPGCGEADESIIAFLPWEAMDDWEPTHDLSPEFAQWLISGGYYGNTAELEADEEAEAWEVIIDHAPVFLAVIRRAITGEMIEDQIRTFDARKREMKEE